MEPSAAPEEPAIKLRSYQQEMLDVSLQRNIIVAMDTGSGKTMVAIARIATELEQTREKLVFFLAPAVALVEQQANALSASLPAYHIRTLTGKDGVDKWTDQRLWDAVLTNVHVVVCTPAVLLDALTHGFVTMKRLSLCVFDEAHRATKNHPMNAIMHRFYHTAKERPRILGLTASPVLNSKKNSLETIERNLDSITVTPKHNRAELELYVHPTELTTISYRAPNNPADPLVNALAREAKLYDFSADPYVMDLGNNRDERSLRELEKVLLKRTTYCSEQLRALDVRAESISKQLGTLSSRWYINECISHFTDGLETGQTVMPDLTEKERDRLREVLHSVQKKGNALSGHTGMITEYSGITPKVLELITILRQHAGTTPRAIIFVEQRVHTTVLSHLLNQLPEITSTYRVGSFVGTSTSSKRKISVADLVGIKDQQQDLEFFRNGQKNLMIATTVLEEGIDIAACNLVICFDPPKNLVSFVQRRGRARQNNSKYFVFVQEDDLKQNSKQWATLEAEMKKAYMDETRQLADEFEDELALSSKSYHIESTGALLTLDNAKSHLYHFCSVGTIQASNYIDLRPEFETEQNDAKSWTASVHLPAFVHPDVRHTQTQDLWRSEQTAIKDAAFEAYVALHKAGLLNDNLLPLIREYGPDVDQQHLDQPALVQVSERLSAWQAIWKAKDIVDWVLYDLTITLDNASIVRAKLYLPTEDLPLEDVELFWNESTTYVASIKLSTTHASYRIHQEQTLLQQTTDLILRSVHGNRMRDQLDFAMLLAPSTEDDSQGWLNDGKGQQAAADFVNQDKPKGLVRLMGQIGRPFFFRSIQHVEQQSSVTVSTFPKRRDFLRRVADDAARTAAYTAMQTLSVEECTVDNLPAEFALLAAFTPSIMHRMDTALLVQNLTRTLLEPVGISDPSLVLEAISSPSTGEEKDFNRLEYLGDAILKHCTELQVMSQHINWPEAYLSLERDRIVRNTNLAISSQELGLDKYILTKPFTGRKWRPIYISDLLAENDGERQREMSTKTLADVVEALIGAAFVDGGLPKAKKCIEELLPSETWLPQPQCFDILIEETRPTNFTNLDLLERLVGHKFKTSCLLVEAITHVSFPYNKTGLSYERLEFLGDSVLDLIITPKLFAHPRNLKHWELHRTHEVLVNSHFLGFCCMAYSIENETFDVHNKPTGGHDINRATRNIHLHDFLRAGHQLSPLRQKSLTAFSALQEEISTALATSNEYPWRQLVALAPQKFFSDLVESVLGAILIDTRGDLAVCEAFVEKLGILQHMRRILDDEVETVSPKERLGAVADRDSVKYINSRVEGDDGQKTFSCTVQVGEREVITISGCGSKNEAEVKGAYEACKVLGDTLGSVTGKRKRKSEAASIIDAVVGDENEGGVVL